MAPGRAQRDRHPRVPQTVFHTLAAGTGGTRLDILAVLAGGRLHVTGIAEFLKISVSTASRHLTELLPGDYVNYFQEGRKHVYELGSAARFHMNGSERPVLELDSDDGCTIAVHLGPPLAALVKEAMIARVERARRDGTGSTPVSQGPPPTPPPPPGAVPAPRGDAPSGPRRPSER